MLTDAYVFPHPFNRRNYSEQIKQVGLSHQVAVPDRLSSHRVNSQFVSDRLQFCSRLIKRSLLKQLVCLAGHIVTNI